MAAGVDHVAPPSLDFVSCACPCPLARATWNAITMLVPLVAMLGCARSKRGKVCPVGHANGPSPHWRAPLPENWLETNGSNGTAIVALLKVWPPSVEVANAAPLLKLLPSDFVPPVLANHETYTWPLGPMAMFGPWLLQTLLIFIGALKVAPWSVEREKTISLQPLPWKSDQAAYTLPFDRSTWMPVLSLKLPWPNVFEARITVRR